MLCVDSVEPINQEYGLYQGTPVARYYIDEYMNAACDGMTGRVLEFGWPTYAKKIKCEYEIIDIDATNRQATIIGDVCDGTFCAKFSGRYDWIICTSVLQLTADPPRAVANMHAMLEQGGSLILAEKALSQIDPWSTTIDRWRFTQHGLKLLMRDFATVDVQPLGNVYTICAYVLGLPAEQIGADKFAYNDPRYPIVTIAHGKK